MELITDIVGTVNGWVWGVPMLILILGAGLFLTVNLRFLSILKIPFGFFPCYGRGVFQVMMPEISRRLTP